MFVIRYIDPQKSWLDPIELFIEEWENASPEMTHFSSGSTGIPKEIQVQKSAMQVSAKRTNSFFTLDEKSNYLLALPAQYIGGKMMILRAYLAQGNLFACPPLLNPLLHYPDDLAIDFAAFTPAQLYAILQNPISRKRFSQIRRCIIGGAPMPYIPEEWTENMHTEIYETYGMTETVSHIALRKRGDSAFQTIDPNIALSVDERDCLVIHDEALSKTPIISNDLVAMQTKDSFIWRGRADHIINSGGLKIYPEEWEMTWKKIGELSERTYYLTSEKDLQFGEILVLMVEGKEIQELENKIASITPKNKRPKKIIYVDQIRRTKNGKIKRQKF